MEKDLYNILGINRNASSEEIRKAYKSLSKTWHPDRFAGKSDAEKKEAEEKFKDINYAYQVLSDPDKKQNYDQFGSEDGPGNMFGNNGFNPFDFNPFESFFGHGHRNRPQVIERGKDIKLNISISIEDLFNGTTKKIKYNKPVRCINCHGAGGTGIKICPHCNGTGMVTERHSMGPGSWSIMNKPCTKCNGTGKIVEHKCTTCHGEGLIKESTTVDINIPAGIIHNDVIRISGMGADSKDRKGTSGDLLAIIQYDFIENDNYELTVENGKVNVTEHVMIPYYDLLLGYTYKAQIPNGTEKNVNIPIGIQDGKKLEIYSGKTNYNIIIHYLYPNKIPNGVQNLLLDIKKIYEN